MLAYTTISDLFYLPSVLELAVYIGGLLFVLACPYLFLGLMNLRRSSGNQQQTPSDSQPQP